ncbi:MAG: hypothetical protein HN932_10685 [Candidatus Marinimicrobia bacterium]|jgi:hypothetical protein|nr:hypothetical protein [Candidatus Neomarinimicrobiota bacterium]MBT3574715.1 hypothetical protein [Candidatus Neomarinimicrobiota bacterium]MBT4252565.1 hypothetical protein [Candidatus Neomarinimicrobiota bacterium]MBT5785299.1 hypothetical protein [Candidatus Neomarinimicrobiota bacterium]MBT5997633.1 hypothetical protein [Candidatus Neomarinimicrobiota bacterium]
MVIFAVVSCDLKQEAKPPTWTNKIEFPLVKESVDLKDLEDEDNISSQLYGDNGEKTIFAYSDTTEMASQEVSDQLAFGDINQSFAQSVDDVTVTGSSINQTSAFDAVGVDPIEEIVESTLGPIELADIPADTTDPFQLNEIFPGVESVPDGNSEVPGGPLAPVYKDFSFTDFSSAVFSGGSLDITINNDMVIPLGAPINIQLQQVVGTDTTDIAGGNVSWSAAIPTGTSSTRSLDLNGITLPANILVLVTGNSDGSNGALVPIDDNARASSFNIAISGSNLVVSSATAKVPSQSITEDGNIALAASANKIQDARISAGTLKIEIVNSMAVASQLVIEITSLEDPSDDAFTKTIPIPANLTTTDENNITGYSLVMDVDLQQVTYSYQINTEDTGDNLVTLAETNQVSVTIALYGETAGADLFFDEITGEIESQLIEEAGDIEITSDSKLLNADISSGSINIDIENRINKPGFDGLPTIVLTIPELKDADNNPLSGSLTLEPFTTVNTLNFNLSEYNLVFSDTTAAGQVLTYTTVVTTPSGELGQYGLEDSIIVDIDVSDMEFAEVTGYFSQDAIVTEDEIILEEATKLIEANFETGDFQLSMTNRIGVVADVNFQIDEFIHKTSGDTLQMDFRLENLATPQVSTLDLSEYKLAFDAGSVMPGVDQGIHYTSTVALPSTEEMTLTFGDSILIDVNITNLAMESVRGIIEPDTLVIDADTVTFEMPDMVSDLMFEHVNIDIDFNSTFDIPIQLSLLLSGTDSLGNSEEIEILHDLTPDDDVVHIDAADLLNIHPESIISSGQAIISDGTSPATIAKGQSMSPIMYINVPLSLIIEDPPALDMDVTSLDSPLPEEGTVTLEEFALYADVINMFEFGATVVVLASNDSLAFDSLAIEAGTAPDADTLMTLELLPLENVDAAEHEITTIEMTSDKLELLEEKLFLKPEVTLLGRTDAGGNNIPSRFFTTDSLTLRTWGSISYTVNGEEF